MFDKHHLRIKLYQSSSKNEAFPQANNIPSTRNSIINRLKLQVFQERLDRQLTKGYETLRQASQTQRKSNQSALSFRKGKQSHQLVDEQKMIKVFKKQIHLKRRSSFSANGQYHTSIIKDNKKSLQNDQIRLINNGDVMEYIQLIYQNYHIKDPLSNQTKMDESVTDCTLTKNRLNSNQLPSLNSARTTKHANIAEISQFNIEESFDSMKRMTNKKSTKKIITLRAKTVKKNEFQVFQDIKLNPLMTLRQNKEYNPKEKEKICIRYCLSCEKPLLERTISKHEST